MKDYELIDHTADLGVKLRAGNLRELFKNAALAMFDIIAEKRRKITVKSGKIEKLIVKQEAGDLDELFINWLNELLSLSAIKEAIFCDFEFNVLGEHRLEARVGGCDIGEYKINSEVKAATYHGLKIEESHGSWNAEVIFDV